MSFCSYCLWIEFTDLCDTYWRSALFTMLQQVVITAYIPAIEYFLAYMTFPFLHSSLYECRELFFF